jgi:hypothetical protein
MEPNKLHIKPNVLSKATKFLQGYGPKYPDGKYMTVTQDYTNSKGNYALANAKNESRAGRFIYYLNEFLPVNLTRVMSTVRDVIMKWVDEHDYSTEMIDTEDLRYRLNQTIQSRYPITFIQDPKIRLHGIQHGGRLICKGKPFQIM